jgi:nucleoside-diphosphate-sugar epimerase
MIKKTLLITGRHGFIGEHLYKRLAEKNHVTAFDGNLLSKELVFTEGVNHIFHLAGKTFVPDSWKNPYDFYSVNLFGTLRVLEFCKKNAISLTHVSAYVYGVPEYLPIDENHRVSPNSPYNHSKLLAEEICKFYAENFGVDVTVLRPFNIYGKGQRRGFVITDLMEQVFNNEVVTLDDIMPKRDFLYIEDFLDVLELTIGLRGFSIYNVGSGKSYSVKEVIEETLSILNSKKAYASRGIFRKNEVADVVADISKIKKELKWTPKYSLRDGLTDMINKIKSEKNSEDKYV